MPADGIQLVCFDLGGVLVRICHHWREGCQLLNLSDGDAEEGLRIWRQRQDLLTDYEAGGFEEDEFFQTAGAALPTIGPDNLRRIYEVWLRGLYDGVDELLDALKQRVTTACLSNTNPTHWRQLTDPAGPYTSLAKLDHLWASHLLGDRKPNDGAFAHVERAANVPGKAIVFYDDNAQNIAAAARRGWCAVQVDPADPIIHITAHLRECGLLAADLR